MGYTSKVVSVFNPEISAINNLKFAWKTEDEIFPESAIRLSISF